MFVSGASTVVNISGGSFSGGARGILGFGGAGGGYGVGGVSDIYGRNYGAAFNGASDLNGLSAGTGIVAADGAQVFVFADIGTFPFTNGTVRGTFGGKSFAIPATITGAGSSIQAGSAVAVPEAGTLALLVPTLALGFVVTRRRR